MDLTAEPLFKGLPHDPATLVERYQSVRRVTEDICAPLATEDYVIQAAPEASPAKWHLGHVSWFFESFVLGPHLKSYKPVDANYRYIFNSYYNGVGPQFSRPARGHLSRPTVKEVYEYRDFVDESVIALIETTGPDELPALGSLLELVVQHH